MKVIQFVIGKNVFIGFVVMGMVFSSANASGVLPKILKFGAEKAKISWNNLGSDFVEKAFNICARFGGAGYCSVLGVVAGMEGARRFNEESLVESAAKVGGAVGAVGGMKLGARFPCVGFTCFGVLSEITLSLLVLSIQKS